MDARGGTVFGNAMLSDDVLAMDAEAAASDIAAKLREQVLGVLGRKGLVIGVSGGVDSAVVASLAKQALGADRVLALLMPERDSSDESLALGRVLVRHLGVPSVEEDMTPVLASAGCYRRQTEAIRAVFPDFGAGWHFKLTLPSPVAGGLLNVSTLTVESPSGESRSSRMPAEAYLRLVAAMNFKQRARKMFEYYHADRLRYAVAGTPNRLEYDQGFFVKQGDGAADVKPIAHLYKSQVRQLASYLGVPPAIIGRVSTTDTFTMFQTQQEFYFGLPLEQMDLCLYGRNHELPAEEVAVAIGLTADQVERVYRDIDQKRRATHYLHARALTIAAIEEVGP